jgi:hypothetical protein
MAEKNVSAAAPGEEPGRATGTRRDYFARMNDLPLDLRLVLSTASVTTRATATEATEAAEAIAWCAGILGLTDLRDALVSAIIDRRTARKGAAR